MENIIICNRVLFHRRGVDIIRITLLTTGSRGDTQPFISLAVYLKSQGHSVILGAKPDFAELIGQFGIEFAPLGRPFKSFVVGGEEIMESGNFAKVFSYMYKQRKLIGENLLEDAYSASIGSDAIIFKYSWSAGFLIAEKLNVPHAGIMFFPITPTAEYPSFTLGKGKDRGRFINAFLMCLGGPYFAWLYQHAANNKFRRDTLGLKPISYNKSYRSMINDKMPLFYTYSPELMPKPSDWPEHIYVTGNWPPLPPPEWAPPADLVSFLDSGPAPVYIGFGSMTSTAERTLKIILEALDIAGKRGIILSGWAGIGNGAVKLPETVYRTDDVYHQWLFPKMAAIVHHGGAGTTASGLYCGVPTIITPFTLDQFGWGGRVHALGAGPAPIPFNELTAGRLASAIIEATTNENIRKRAQELSDIIKRENGLQKTVDIFMKHYENEQNRKRI